MCKTQQCAERNNGKKVFLQENGDKENFVGFLKSVEYNNPGRGKRKSETNGGGRRTYISPKGCPPHQVKHGAKKHNGHSEMAETQTKTQKGYGNAAK